MPMQSSIHFYVNWARGRLDDNGNTGHFRWRQSNAATANSSEPPDQDSWPFPLELGGISRRDEGHHCAMIWDGFMRLTDRQPYYSIAVALLSLGANVGIANAQTNNSPAERCGH